jgi:hypothetical protein
MAHIDLAEGTGGPRPPGWVRVSEHPAHRELHLPELATRRPRPIVEPRSPRSTTMKPHGKPLADGVGCQSTRRDRPILRRVGKRSDPQVAKPCHVVGCASLTHPTQRRLPHFGTLSIHLDPRRSSQQLMSRELQPKNRQVKLVYKRSNFAGKPPFLATFGDARHAFQAAILTQHVVAAT